MAVYQWGLVCQQVIIDKYTNNISYINALEGIKPPDYPAELPQIFVGTVWRRDEKGEEIEVRIVLEDDDGNELYTGSIDSIDFSDYKRYRSNNVISGIDIEEPGTIWFHAEKKEDGDWTREASLPVDIGVSP